MPKTLSTAEDHRRQSLLLGIVLIATLLAYAAGLRGDFMFDDVPNITANHKVQIQSLGWNDLKQAWNSGVVGLGGRALAMLSFGVNHALTGLNPGAFKVVNLLLHLANGLLVLKLARLLLRLAGGSPNGYMPLWISAAWLLHPINLTPVLLVVQRMTELAALFSFASVLLYLRMRTAPPNSRPLRWAGWAGLPLLWVMSFLSKETGALAPLYAVALEYFVLSRAAGVSPLPRVWGKIVLGALFMTMAVTAIMAFLGSWVFSPSAYGDRDFTLNERLMSEARIVWFYVKLVLLPVFSDFNLFHDGFAVSRGLLSPWTTIAAICAWAMVLVLLASRGREAPLMGFGVAWFLAGHLLESTFMPLELIFEHRNYLPSFGLILSLAGVAHLLRDTLATRIGARTGFLLGCLPLIILATMTAQRAYAYGAPVRLFELEVEHNPNSYRAHQNLASALFDANLGTVGSDPSLRQRIQMHLARAAELNREAAYPYLAKLYLACTFGDPIDPMWSEALLEQWGGPRPYGERMHTMATFSKAAIAGQLCMDETHATRHFRTFLDNPRVPKHYHAEIQLRYAEFVYLVVGDTPAAVRLARQAFSEAQTPSLVQQYASFLNRIGETEEAKRILKSIPLHQRAF